MAHLPRSRKANKFVFPDCLEFKTSSADGLIIQRMRIFLKKIADQLGFIDSLQPYALRRMVGNAAESDVGVSDIERRLYLSHTVGSNVFERHYIHAVPQLDIQQLTRNLTEDRSFLEGISGYCARKINNAEHHRLAVNSLVDQQEDVIYLRQKISAVRSEYNCKYGSKRAGLKADPALVYQIYTLDSKLNHALVRHRTQFSKKLRQQDSNLR